MNELDIGDYISLLLDNYTKYGFDLFFSHKFGTLQCFQKFMNLVHKFGTLKCFLKLMDLVDIQLDRKIKH